MTDFFNLLKIFFALSILIIQLSVSKDYTGYKLVRINSFAGNRHEFYNRLFKKVDFWTNPDENYASFMVSPAEYNNVVSFLKSRNISSQITISDIQDMINSQISSTEDNSIDRVDKRIAKRGILDDFFQLFSSPVRHANNGESEQRNPRELTFTSVNSVEIGKPSMNWVKYHRLETIYSYLYEISERYPSIVSVLRIGKSSEKRDILLIKIGNPQPYDKPIIFIEAGIHAREWISPATATYIIQELVQNQQRHKDILDYYDFYILPVMNPDGYEYSFKKDRLWRKSRSKNGGIFGLLLPNCIGVDLNRNFGYKWLATHSSLFDSQGGSRLSCVETYAGRKPYSEPETYAVSNFIMKNRNRIRAYLSLHSFGQKVIYPWSHTNKKVSDWKELHEMGEFLAKSITASSGVNAFYEVGTSSEIQYKASGGSDDFARGAAGIKWVFLIELPDEGHFGFLLPSSLIESVAFSIFNGIKAFALKIR